MWTTANAVETPGVWPTGMVIVAPLVSVITSGEPVTWFDTCAVIVAVAVPSTTETSSSVTTVASLVVQNRKAESSCRGIAVAVRHCVGAAGRTTRQVDVVRLRREDVGSVGLHLDCAVRDGDRLREAVATEVQRRAIDVRNRRAVGPCQEVQCAGNRRTSLGHVLRSFRRRSRAVILELDAEGDVRDRAARITVIIGNCRLDPQVCRDGRDVVECCGVRAVEAMRDRLVLSYPDSAIRGDVDLEDLRCICRTDEYAVRIRRKQDLDAVQREKAGTYINERIAAGIRDCKGKGRGLVGAHRRVVEQGQGTD